MALENVCQLEQTTTHRRYAIFTDSLSTIDNLASSRSRSRPNLLSDMIDLLHSVNSHITVVWVPSHIGITGNERADQLANMGSKRQHIDIDVGVELQEMYGRVDTYINKLWQEHWNNETTGRHFYNVQPDVVSRDRILFETRTSPRAPTSTRKMQTQLLSAQDSAARHRHLRQLWTSRNHRALSHQLFAERNCSSCQEYLLPTEDQLHITDHPTSGSGPGRAPLLTDSCESQPRIRSLTPYTANRNPTLTVSVTI